ncbi:MAG TPA: hypothetical protein VNZ57_14260 [Longimicrobiales bacterium]|nr:hypothetical protein [Longimicrobiales bacterium]
MSGALRFERLRVRRMPGIDSEYVLPELAPGLNVIHGPNASGKTTTARALESILWPRDAAPRLASLDATFMLGEDRWTVDLDGGSARWQRNGQDVDSPSGVPAPTSRDCYRFPLHELITGVDQRLAEEIVRVSAGGYDLKAAAAPLGARDTVTRNATARKQAWDAARARLEAARQKQAELFQDERRIEDLRRDEEAAEAAERRARLLERAVAHARAVAEAERAAAALAAYPEAMGALHGDEVARLAELRRKAEEARVELGKAEDRLRESRSMLELAGLPEGGVAQSVITALRTRLEEIRELERTIANSRQDLASAEKARDEELRLLGDFADEKRLREIDIGSVAEIEDFAQNAEAARAEREAVRALLDLVGESEAPADLERVRRGVDALQGWLRSPGPSLAEARLRRIALVAAGALIVAGAAGGFSGSPILWLAAVVGVILLALATSARGEVGSREVYRRELEQLGIGSPGAWEHGAVGEFLDQLIRQLEAGREAARRADHRAELEKRLTRLDGERAGLEERRRELAARLGAAPDASAPRLAWLCSRIARWQNAVAEVAALTAGIEEATAQLTTALREAASRVALYGYAGELTGSADLKGVIDDLDARREQHDRAAATLREAERARETAERTIAEVESARMTIFERFGLLDLEGADAERAIVEWCRDHPGFLKARERKVAAEGAVEQARKEVAATDGFTPDLLDRNEDELVDDLAIARERAAELQRIREEITEIRTRVHEAKSSHAVEEALAEYEHCEAELIEARETDTLAAVASVLVDYVQSVTRESHLPQVFRRARELFTRITHGRYRLDFAPGNPPVFRATETSTGIGRALDELSSGTRVQLLMAVRIAFVEEQEAAGVKLPLVFDETLGNSDDARAEAIMEAILTLAADGRQVFYFTAQPDEVGKWRMVLGRRPEVPHRIIDLAHARRLAAHDGFTPAIADVPREQVPEPDGMTQEEYGRVLLVPPLDPEGDIGSVHLWYLFDDLDALYRLLRVHVESWGALRTLVESGGAPLLGQDESVYRRAEAAVRALERAFSLVRIGRGKKVDRSVLDASGAVSGSFMDRVAELCRECGGDAKDLLERMRVGAVPRFRNDARERLRDYLLDNGYLDERDPLGHEELRLRTLAAVAREIDEGRLTPADVDRLLAHLGVRVPVPAA